MTTQEQPKLVKVKIETQLGAIYEFPDMALATMEALIASETLHGFAQVSLVNQSGSCLVVPARIINTISIDGEIKWVCRA